MGWNSWNKFGCSINEELITNTAQKLVSTGLAAKGYDYLNLDDCWQLSRDSTGRIVEDFKAFPSGMKNLSIYVHSLGLKFGLYSSAGNYTCQGRPGSLGFEEIDAKTYAEWEVDYLKYDNCYNNKVSGKNIRYPAMRDALNKTGRPIFYSICNWGEENTATWAAEVGNSWRTTGDIVDNWFSFLWILDSQVGLENYSKQGAWNDPDMLEVGNGKMSASEYQAHFALWALLKAPLLIGTDLNTMSPEILSILGNEEIIAINQDKLGKQGKRIKNNFGIFGATEVWSGELSDGIAIILFNRSFLSSWSIKANFNECGFKDVGGILRNLVTKENYGYVKSSFSAKVPKHSVVVLKLYNN